jgi:hypothetical protein
MMRVSKWVQADGRVTYRCCARSPPCMRGEREREIRSGSRVADTFLIVVLRYPTATTLWPELPPVTAFPVAAF